MKLRKIAIVGAVALALMGTVTSVVLVHGNIITKDKKSDYAETERLRGDRTHDIVEVSESIADDDSFMGENVTGKNDYYKSGRGIACWGDSMTEGMGSDEGYILTDVGSVKTNIHEEAETLGLGKYFIGGHPMAGSEKSGYSNSKAMLIEHITWECQVKNQMRFQDVQADLGCILTEIYI